MPEHTRSHFIIEKMNESWGHCDCCGRDSRSVWGVVHDSSDATVAAYWMHWTEGHLSDTGANLDLVLGEWGDETAPKDRYLVALVHRQQPDGPPALMVIDARERPAASGNIADTALRREDVIGTPLAEQVFALTNAIYEQDERFF
jgi:hypothetical protein